MMTTEQRIEKLEKDLMYAKRQNKIILTVLFLLVSFLVLICTGMNKLSSTYAKGNAQDTIPKVIRAQMFAVEDKDGKLRASLAITEDGPILHLSGEDDSGAMLSISDGKSKLALRDKNGKILISLAVKEDGPILVLGDKNGKACVNLAVAENGPGLLLLDRNGEACAMLNAADCEPMLGLSDADGKNRAMLVAGKNGPALNLFDKKGEPRVSLVLGEDGLGLGLFDEDGKILWSTPINK